jgi:two-component system OmpR family sensor kinase
MLHSEKRSFFRFLIIYLSSTFLLFFIATLIFYNYQKHNILDNQRDKLNVEADHLLKDLRKLHHQFTDPLIYPSHTSYHSAIYSADKEYIFGSFTPSVILWDREFYIEKKSIFHIRNVEPYYLGAKYLILKRDIKQDEIVALQKNLSIFLLIAGVLFTLLGIFLGKLFIAPMRDAMSRVNGFIEDTTHELNTPISTILTNIELIETLYECEAKEEMKRIEIASKTLSRLYDDLTYLKLNHNYHREVMRINISKLLEERLRYFHSMIEVKSLYIEENIERNIIIVIDRNDALRLIDNLLSNAIKYNQKNGRISVRLTNSLLSISDSGIGIKKEDLSRIMERFSRANSSEGGFGIGLDIVGQVVKEYNFKFDIKSTYKEGTEVVIKW